MKLLIPIDIAHQNTDLIEKAARLVNFSESEVILAYVQEILPSYESTVYANSHYLGELRSEIEKGCKKVFEPLTTDLEARGAKVETLTMQGIPTQVLEVICQDKKIDLTIVSPGSHNTIERFFLGSTSRRLVKTLPNSTLIVKNIDSTYAIKKVVVGYDGSKDAIKSLASMIKLLNFNQLQPEVIVFHAISISPAISLFTPAQVVTTLENNLAMEANALVLAAEKILKDYQIENYSNHVCHGDASRELLNYQKKIGADLIVVGARGHSNIEHLLLGSITDKIISHSSCPVLVTR